MGKWSRWQDWVALVAGVYAFLSPIWTTSPGKATWTLVVLGIVTALIALWSLASPATVATEWLVAALGVLVFISPWVMGFHSVNGIAWTAWIVGVVTFVVGASTVQHSRAVDRGTLVSQH